MSAPAHRGFNAYDGFSDYLGIEGIRQNILDALAPDPDLKVSEWADRHRKLSSRGSAEPGDYRTSRTPYLKEIMDSLGPEEPARKIVFQKGAQVGATEAGNNWVGFCIHQAPGPFMLVQPTLDMSKRNTTQKLDPMIEDSPVLRERIQPGRSRDSGNTQTGKKFRGGFLALTGANSATGLRSFSARYVFLDEVDAYVGDLDGEGDPVNLAWARMNSFGHRKKMLLASTPTIKGMSRIEREFEASDQRRYHVPCPECGVLQWLKFEQLKWQKGRPKTVYYECEDPNCKHAILEFHKTEMMDPASGACWIPTATEEAQAKATEDGVIGFHISALYSPVGWLSWADIAQQWEEAQGKDGELKTFKNTVLGECWQERGEAPDWQRLYDRRDQRQRRGYVPLGGLVLTAGADVQRDRIEVSVYAWGRNLRSWLVDHVVIDGDPQQEAVWEKLSAFLNVTWPSRAGPRMAVARLAIDSGDGVTTNRVYQWARKSGRGQVIAIKGDKKFDKLTPVNGPTFVEVTEGGRKLRRGVQLWTISVSVFKSETYRWLRQVMPTDEELAEGVLAPAGYIGLPAETTAEFLKQLTAEQLVTKRNKRGYASLEWQQMRERNEALDCRVYARAAAWLMGIDRWDDKRWAEFEDQIADAAPEGPAVGQTSPRPPPAPGGQSSRAPGILGGRQKDRR